MFAFLINPIASVPFIPFGLNSSANLPNSLLVELNQTLFSGPFKRSSIELFFLALNTCWRTRWGCMMCVGTTGILILGNGERGITLGEPAGLFGLLNKSGDCGTVGLTFGGSATGQGGGFGA
eukprot:1617387-Ditylum_brightwellii.AAC.1